MEYTTTKNICIWGERLDAETRAELENFITASNFDGNTRVIDGEEIGNAIKDAGGDMPEIVLTELKELDAILIKEKAQTIVLWF